jgi:hypothetical protein
VIINRGRLVATLGQDQLTDGQRSLEDLYLTLTTKEAV